MNLYTSYWAMVRNFPKNLVGLNTTIWPPKWRPLGQDKRGIWVIDCPPLKPGKGCSNLCRGLCEPRHPQDCDFLQKYYEQLSQINFSKFCDSLQNLANRVKKHENLEDVDFAFIVFETPKNACSERIIIQQWLCDNNVKIQEWSQVAENT